ncbi:ORF6C domain-containing protein [Blautia sp.]|uniref:ORF6C domain-containing protein n=1 Tax=Blautia sp. TaxID=1955243 RepID=UPI003AB30BF9
MNELQIFNSEEFGEIRTATIDNEPWFVGKDVAEALGYANTRDALATHVMDEDKNTVVISDGKRGNPNQTVINESGLYALIFGSKLESAKRFKHWVTSEVLPAIRKTGSYQMQNLSTEMKAILMHDEKLVKIDQRVSGLENTMTIDYGQQKVLGDCVNRVVIDALGGKGSEAYREISKKVFSECNRDLKNYFHVNARNNVPKKRFDEAVEYISGWRPCTNTILLIKECNSQMNMDV